MNHIYYLTRYHKKVIGTTDKDTIAILYAYYMRLLEQNKPGSFDGAALQGKRIRVVVGDSNVYDVCADGSIVDAKKIKVNMDTGMP